MFAMFIACALIPIFALAVICYYRVTNQLKDQAWERLQQAAKSHGMSIYEHLLLADQNLMVVQGFLSSNKDKLLSTLPPTAVDYTEELFSGLAWIQDATVITLWDWELPAASLPIISNMRSTKESVRLAVWQDTRQWPSVAIIRRIDRPDGPQFLVGQLNASFLWGLERGTILPANSDFCMWDSQGYKLFCSLAMTNESAKKIINSPSKQFKGQIEVSIDDKKYFAAHWSLFLKPRFGISHWTVMVLEPKEHVLEPMHFFRAIFPLILIGVFVIVTWLSSRAIRKNLVPIVSLMEGARHVADKRFDYRVEVESSDELGDLAVLFNQMTRQLDIQFQALVGRADMDRAILSVLDLKKIIVTSLNLSAKIIAYDSVAISIMDSISPITGHSYVRNQRNANQPPTVVPFQLSTEDYQRFESHPNWICIDAADQSAPEYLKVLRHDALDCIYIFPIWISKYIYALLNIGVRRENEFDQIVLEQVRGFADHLAVAFTNANLMKELKDLNLGTLYALARTVDAKSAWTAGHSLRVTQLAVDLAVGMGIEFSSREDLRRAALLHDIGKIGIPLTILDKKAELTVEEYDIIKGHPSIGAKILKPIGAYATVIPVIEQHHERFDGEGYPFGLRGDQIHPLARILTVSDAFDAMVSDRPYRKGLSVDEALQIIQEEAGHQFDPQMVGLFLKMGPPSYFLDPALLDRPSDPLLENPL